jgi:hypothetical protein
MDRVGEIGTTAGRRITIYAACYGLVFGASRVYGRHRRRGAVVATTIDAGMR